MEIQINTPRWALPLLEPRRYKGIKGGRGGGKSHFFAELMVEETVINPNQRNVCAREIQKSLKHSAKTLIEAKIEELGVSHLFDIQLNEIKRKDGNGLFIFQGLQDHTVDSIKSLEGFDRLWVEEAHKLTKRSLDIARPTFRREDSEIWFSWNPEDEDDAVDTFMLDGVETSPDDFVLVHVNSEDNPWLPDTLRQERERDRINRPDDFGHIWLGEYNTKSDAQIFKGKWTVQAFEPKANWSGPYYGLDFGFATDPTAAVKCWVGDRCLWIEYEAGKVGLELDDTANHLACILGISDHVIRADSARPESISYLKRHGLPRIAAVAKGKGSVEDGIEHIKSYDRIVIHPRCENMQKEARLYSYKIDKRSGDIMPSIEDKHNHYWDAVRYAIQPLIKQNQAAKQLSLKIR